MALTRKNHEFAIQFNIHGGNQYCAQMLYFENCRPEGDENFTISYCEIASKKGKAVGAEKFLSARRADDFKKLSARAKICRPRADGPT